MLGPTLGLECVEFCVSVSLMEHHQGSLLASFLEKEGIVTSTSRVLELGSGIGLLAVHAAKTCTVMVMCVVYI